MTLITIYFTKYNYSAISDIIEILGGYEEEKSGDEISYIKNSLLKKIEDNDKINLTLLTQMTALRNIFFSRLLKGHIQEQNMSQAYFETYDIKFEQDAFSVILVYFEDLKEPTNVKNEKEIFEIYAIRKFIATNVLEDLLQQPQKGYVFQIDDILAIIINSKNDKEAWKEEVNNLAAWMIQFFKENYQINVFFTSSDLHLGYESLETSYSEASKVMEYNLTTSNKVFFYGDLNEQNASVYRYTIEDEQFLVNSLKSNNLELFEKRLDRIIDQNIQNEALSAISLFCFKNDLINTVIKTMDTLGKQHKKTYISQSDIYNLTEQKNLISLKQMILELVKPIMHYEKDDIMKSSEVIVTRIITIVEENYVNEDLNNSFIATKLNNHPNYISSIFKSEYGKGLNEFINHFRIEKAKVMLKFSNETIDKITKAVGYSNTRNFIRVFKKYEGMTPTQYRETL